MPGIWDDSGGVFDDSAGVWDDDTTNLRSPGAIIITVSAAKPVAAFTPQRPAAVISAAYPIITIIGER